MSIFTLQSIFSIQDYALLSSKQRKPLVENNSPLFCPCKIKCETSLCIFYLLKKALCSVILCACLVASQTFNTVFITNHIIPDSDNRIKSICLINKSCISTVSDNTDALGKTHTSFKTFKTSTFEIKEPWTFRLRRPWSCQLVTGWKKSVYFFSERC